MKWYGKMSKKNKRPQAPKVRNFVAKEMLDPESPFHEKTFRDVAKDEKSFRKAKHKKKFWEMQDDRYN